MNEFVIVTDSTVDLPVEVANDNDLVVLPLTYHLEVGNESTDYTNYLDYREQDVKEFYTLLKSGARATTSQLNSEDFIQAIEPLLKAGKDVLILPFSSKLSGTFNSGRLAKLELDEKYPERKILLIDSKAVSLGLGMLTVLAAKEKAKGKTIDEVYDFVIETAPHIAHWFTVDDISHLRRGGRIGATSAIVARALSIKPILHCNEEGELIARHKAISRRKSIRELFAKMTQTAIPNQEIVYIGHGDSIEDAEFLKELVLKEYPNVDVLINNIGTVIGAHTGQGVLALFFMATGR